MRRRRLLYHQEAVVAAPPVATSYTNPGGQGNRTAIITITTDITASIGTHSMLINGTEATEYAWAVGQTNKIMTFDFGSPKVIDEFTWTQSNVAVHGSNQTFAGSNDNIGYTNFPNTIQLGVTANYIATITNTTPYRYYRLIVPGAVSGSPYILEIKFKIA